MVLLCIDVARWCKQVRDIGESLRYPVGAVRCAPCNSGNVLGGCQVYVYSLSGIINLAAIGTVTGA